MSASMTKQFLMNEFLSDGELAIGMHKSALATSFLMPLIYLIVGAYSSTINLQHRTWSVVKLSKVRFL